MVRTIWNCLNIQKMVGFFSTVERLKQLQRPTDRRTDGPMIIILVVIIVDQAPDAVVTSIRKCKWGCPSCPIVIFMSRVLKVSAQLRSWNASGAEEFDLIGGANHCISHFHDCVLAAALYHILPSHLPVLH